MQIDFPCRKGVAAGQATPAAQAAHGSVRRPERKTPNAKRFRREQPSSCRLLPRGAGEEEAEGPAFLLDFFLTGTH